MWTLTGATTEYTVAAAGRFLALVAWGPHGVTDGPAALSFAGRVPYLTPGDVAAVDYAPVHRRSRERHLAPRSFKWHASCED